MRCLLCLLLLTLCPAAALAGAWLREEGTGFSSLSFYASEPFDEESYYTGLYLEYGLRPNLTVGFDLGRGVTGQGKTIAFARLPIKRQGQNRLAFELGLGRIAGQQVLRPGLAYGRGFDTRWGGGWLALDSFVELDLGDRQVDVKSDLTLGVTLDSGRRWMLQLQAGRAADEPEFLRIVPSTTYEIRPGWQLELGLSKALTGARESGVKLGLWRAF